MNKKETYTKYSRIFDARIDFLKEELKEIRPFVSNFREVQRVTKKNFLVLFNTFNLLHFEFFKTNIQNNLKGSIKRRSKVLSKDYIIELWYGQISQDDMKCYDELIGMLSKSCTPSTHLEKMYLVCYLRLYYALFQTQVTGPKFLKHFL